MTTVGPQLWSSKFDQADFYNPKDLDYLNWSREFQPGYMFRNLGNEDVHYNKQIIRLLQNYRSAYMQLAVTYYLDYQKESRKKDKLMAAFDNADRNNITATDEAALMEAMGFSIALVEGHPNNFKITTQDDWERAVQLFLRKTQGTGKE